MDNNTSPEVLAVKQRRRALARWENDGGTTPCGRQAIEALPAGEDAADDASDPQVELVAQSIRLIALENLVIALLAAGNTWQHRLAKGMAEHIPLPGMPSHPLAMYVAAHMGDLIGHAVQMRAGQANG
jgi:hypothetical protein